MRLFFSAAARDELDEAFQFLEQQQPGLGYRFTADVDEALARILNQPLAWRAAILGAATSGIFGMA